MTSALDQRFVGLSCYTSNLASYLAAEFPATDARLAESIRLAVRTDLPDAQLAFSHHAVALDRLPDATRLTHASTERNADARDGLEAELQRHGRALVVTDNARLPWSPSYGTDAAAPHLLLVDGRDGGRWHVADAFHALLESGEQAPFSGWLSTHALTAAMTSPARWTPEQDRRNELAFGFPSAVERGRRLRWLRREPDRAAAAPLPGDWLFGDEHVLPFLAEHVIEHGAAAEGYLDDLWTAARHHAFRHRRAGFTAAAAAWEQLPQALRFAVTSSRRGRPRPALVRATFAHLLRLEAACPPHPPREP